MSLIASVTRKPLTQFNQNTAVTTAVSFFGLMNDVEDPDQTGMSVALNKIEREDGTGESYLISGHVVDEDGLSSVQFEGTYNVRSQRGILTLTDS